MRAAGTVKEKDKRERERQRKKEGLRGRGAPKPPGLRWRRECPRFVTNRQIFQTVVLPTYLPTYCANYRIPLFKQAPHHPPGRYSARCPSALLVLSRQPPHHPRSQNRLLVVRTWPSATVRGARTPYGSLLVNSALKEKKKTRDVNCLRLLTYMYMYSVYGLARERRSAGRRDRERVRRGSATASRESRRVRRRSRLARLDEQR